MMKRRSGPFITSLVRCRAGAVANSGVWYGPGSAKRHEECRIAPGTRVIL